MNSAGGGRSRARFGRQTVRAQSLALHSCETLEKLLKLSVLPFFSSIK